VEALINPAGLENLPGFLRNPMNYETYATPGPSNWIYLPVVRRD